MIHQREKKDSSKANLIVSAVFHGAIILVIFVFAAREGMLGKKLKEISATLVPKEKKPEPPKPKPEVAKEAPKQEEQKVVAAAPPKVEPRATTAPPPSDNQAPAVAPAAAVLSGFEFGGGKEVISMASDPKSLYKAKIERALREAWKRPSDIQDDNFVVRVDLSIEATGRLTGYRWIAGTGNTRWDASVREVLDNTRNVGTPPPKGFPGAVEVRFDVETEAVDPKPLGTL